MPFHAISSCPILFHSISFNSIDYFICFEAVSGISSRRNRKRKAFVNKTVKFIWHYSNLYEKENSPCHKCVRCYHDGNLLEHSKVIIKKSKVIVRLKNVTVHDTGFYWSEIKDSSNLTLVSSFMQLRVIPSEY